MAEKNLFANEWMELVVKILVAHRTDQKNAYSVAEALVAAEIDGQKGHGLSRVPAYAGQAKSGKVDGYAQPQLAKVAPALLRVNACHGFAYPALDLAVETLSDLTKETGVALAGIAHSHHFGVAGYYAEQLAKAGLIGLTLSNSPAAIAPWGGKKALFGTNPIAFAVPREGAAPLVIDLSLSKVARGKIKLAAEKGDAIPEGWALDKDGNTTTDAKAAMSGTMLPMGEAKGAALVLMVEILTAALTASHFGYEASSFFETEGSPPAIGQCLLAINPGPLSQNQFSARLETLVETMLAQAGTRLPGSNKAQLREKAKTEGVAIEEVFYQSLIKLSGDGKAVF